MLTRAELPGHIQLLHKINAFLHVEPYATILYGLFWHLLLLFSLPILSFSIIFYTAYQIIRQTTGLRNATIDPKHLKADQGKELAVVLTGCDSGFGLETAFSLVSQGFIVFAACLKKESFELFKGAANIHPLVMDVTNDKQIEDAYMAVRAWLAEDDKRYLHALINNAGLGTAGLIDWLHVSDFQQMMDVNFLGTVRSCKTFLPIFKRQAADGSHRDARIVNVVSTAGVFAGGVLTVAYECSKHAQDAFTTNLRLEMKPFGIHVTAVTPGSHRTPIIDGKNIASGLRRVWGKMTKEHQEEYGPDYFETVAGKFENGRGRFVWDMKHVVDALEQSVLQQYPPARMFVGLDAKFILDPLSKLPAGVGMNMIKCKPAIMTKKK